MQLLATPIIIIIVDGEMMSKENCEWGYKFSRVPLTHVLTFVNKMEAIEINTAAWTHEGDPDMMATV